MGILDKFRKAEESFRNFQTNELEKQLDKYSQGKPKEKEKLKKGYFGTRNSLWD
jgi:hypothetical protein